MMWLSCLLQIRRRGLLFGFSWVSGSNTWRSHCNPCLLLVHLLVLQPNRQLLWMLAGIYWHDRFSPLNLINGGIELPLAQMHSTLVTHSWRPSFAWNFWQIIVLIICWEASISPIANPLSSIFIEIFRINLCSLMICSKSSNHFVNRSSDTSLILAASIHFLLALLSWGWRDIKQATKSLPNSS
jgi:hypothetical protein